MTIRAGRIILPMLAIALACGLQRAPLAQEDQGATHHATLATSYGENTIGPSIFDEDVRKLLDKHVTTYHSTLLIFTQCYAGDMVDDFQGRANTAVLSATAPGEPSYYGGYETGAGNELKPGAGRTSDNVHQGGLATKNKAESPFKVGAAVSLEPTSADGPIKSRHVLFYAGQPDSREGRDFDQRDHIKNNFKGQLNTTVTSVGGPPDDQGNGKDGWDYPGNFNGLTAALKEIGAQMSADEQFILFISDHGGRGKSYNAFELETDETTFTLNLSTSMLTDMVLEEGNIDTGILLQASPGQELEQPLQAGDLTVELPASGASVDLPVTQVISYDSEPDEDSFYRFFFPFTEDELIPWAPADWPVDENDRVPISFNVSSSFSTPMQFDFVSIDSGAISKLPPPSEPGSDTPSVGSGPHPPPSSISGGSSDSAIPLLQVALPAPSGGMNVSGITLELNGNGDPALLAGLDIWHDVNGNGQADGSDELLSQPSVPLLKDVPLVGNFLSSVPVDDSQELLILVTAKLVPPDEGSSVALGRPAAGTPLRAAWPALLLLMLPLPWLRRRRRLVLATAGLLAGLYLLTLAGCGGGGGGDNNPNPQTQSYTAWLTGVDATRTADSTAVDFDGLPFKGSTLNVNR